jgi:hypothetical protein
MTDDDKSFTGTHTEGFRAATAAAVEDFHKKNGVTEKPVKLQVLEMYVTVHNPIHDYVVRLGLPE